MEPVYRKGELTKWNDDRGFGFIHPSEDDKEAFLHISALTNKGRRPKVGDIIYYQVTSDREGRLRATHAFIDPPSSSPASGEAMVWLQTLLLSALPIGGSIALFMMSGIAIPLILYPVVSVLTFMLYSGDKASAQQGGWRVPEAILHACELLGGWIGAFIAQQTLRHKSRKASYQAVFWTIVVAHCAFWLVWIVLVWRTRYAA